VHRYARLCHHGGFCHSGGGLEGNPLKRCLKGVIRCEWWISALRGGGGSVLVSQGCVVAQLTIVTGNSGNTSKSKVTGQKEEEILFQ
jgi:hypothetical protein